MIINEFNDEIVKKAKEATDFAFERYICPFMQKLNYQNVSQLTQEQITKLASLAAYVPASRDVLTYSGSTISESSFFLPKDTRDIKRRQDILINKICKDVIMPFLSFNDFKKEKCFDVMDVIFEIMYFRENIKDFSYGNSQKWVNMAIKFYFVILAKKKYSSNIIRLFNETHLYDYSLFPVDSIMMKIIKADFGQMAINNNINSPFSSPTPWSSCNSKITFKAYWDFMAEKCSSIPPILYEICNWEPKD